MLKYHLGAHELGDLVLTNAKFPKTDIFVQSEKPLQDGPRIFIAGSAFETKKPSDYGVNFEVAGSIASLVGYGFKMASSTDSITLFTGGAPGLGAIAIMGARHIDNVDGLGPSTQNGSHKMMVDSALTAGHSSDNILAYAFSPRKDIDEHDSHTHPFDGFTGIHPTAAYDAHVFPCATQSFTATTARQLYLVRERFAINLSNGTIAVAGGAGTIEECELSLRLGVPLHLILGGGGLVDKYAKDLQSTAYRLKVPITITDDPVVAVGNAIDYSGITHAKRQKSFDRFKDHLESIVAYN